MAMPPTRAENYYGGYPDRTQRMGPQTMMGAAQTTVSPYQQTGGFGGYDGGPMEPRRSWARRWLPWLIPALVVVAVIVAAALLLRGNGGKTYSVPLVNGEPKATAVAQIRQAGLVPQVVERHDPTVAPGLVINTNPPNGNSVPKGSTVQVFVSQGAAKVQIPNVAGLQEGAAQQKLASKGLNRVTIQSDPKSLLPQGEVDRTSPPAGTLVDPNTTITLYISGGGVKVQSVIGDTLQVAQEILGGQGFKVQAIPSPAPAGQPVAPGTVWNMNPSAGTLLPTGSTIQIFYQPQPTGSPTSSPSSSPSTTPPTSPSPTPSDTTTSPSPTPSDTTTGP